MASSLYFCSIPVPELLDDVKKLYGLTGLEVALVSAESVANHVVPQYNIFFLSQKPVINSF